MKPKHEESKKYRVSADLKPFIRGVLIRGFYHVRFAKEDEQWYCYTNCTSDAFHKVVQRAKCEKISKENGGALYVTEVEARNQGLINELMKQKGVNSYRILRKEKETDS